jgi:hypothetical protein
VTVVLHHRAAAGRVHGDPVGPGSLEGIDVAAGQVLSASLVTGVRVERATALLARCCHRPVAIAREHALGGPVGVTEQTLHHTAVERGNGAARRGVCRRTRVRRESGPGGLQHRERETGAARKTRQESRQA